MQRAPSNHYATLGLDRGCTPAQIRAAYRLLAKQHHPDLNPDSPAAVTRTQTLNAAHKILSDPERRRDYDRELAAPKKAAAPARAKTTAGNISKEASLKPEDFLRGATLDIRVNDPANPDGAENYSLIIPPETAPGTRFKIPRTPPFDRSFVLVRVKARPDFRFKVRGPDLRCDLRITSQRAAQGGTESVRGITGNFLRLQIPRGLARGEILRITGEGLPRPRGGRGDLLLRVTYTPQVRITRK